MSSSVCPSCSKDLRQFTGELALHYPGLKGLDKPIVWEFTDVLVCLNCGLAVFALENDALKEARQTYADDGHPGMNDLARAS